MTKQEKKIALLAVNNAEELCKTINGFNELDNEAKAIATIFASIAILNKAFNEITKHYK